MSDECLSANQPKLSSGFLIVSPRFQSCQDNRYSVNVTHAFLPLISFPKLGGILSLPQNSSHRILPIQSPQLARLSLILNLFLSFLIHYIHPRDHFLIKFEVATMQRYRMNSKTKITQESNTRFKARLTAVPLVKNTTNLFHRTALWTSLLSLLPTLKITNVNTAGTLCYLCLL